MRAVVRFENCAEVEPLFITNGNRARKGELFHRERVRAKIDVLDRRVPRMELIVPMRPWGGYRICANLRIVIGISVEVGVFVALLQAWKLLIPSSWYTGPS